MQIFGLNHRKNDKRFPPAFRGFGGKKGIICSQLSNFGPIRGGGGAAMLKGSTYSMLSVHLCHVHDIAAATCVVHDLKECKWGGLLGG